MKKKKFLLATCLSVLFMAIMIVAFPQQTKAAGAYLIKVNKATNVVTVYTSNGGTAITAFPCSTGAATEPGTYSTLNKYRWQELDGPSYGQYCTRIYGHVLFHSVWYYQQDVTTQSTVQFNKLGTTASHGCVRLTTAAAKWIYDNCGLGTTVVIFNGTAADDPLGKPTAIKVPTTSRTGWDPTDPNPANPYLYTKPSINTAWVPTTISYGSTWNPLAGVYALNSCGVESPELITYTGNVNTKKLGTYTITYTITDQLGRSASTSVKIKVKDTAAPILKGVKAKKTVEYNTSYKIKKGITAKTVSKKNLTKKIVVKVKAPGSKTYKTYKKTTLKVNKVGTYYISYAVKNPYNKIKMTKTLKLTVKDTKPPVIKGSGKTITKEYKQVVNLRSGVTAKLVSGKNLSSKMLVYVKYPGASKYSKLSTTKSKKYTLSKLGTYSVKYVSTNPTSKKKTTKYTKIVVKDTKTPSLTNSTATATTEYNTSTNLLTGISAKTVSGTNLTAQVKVYVPTAPGSSSYTELSQAQAAGYAFTATGTYKVKYVVYNPTKNAQGTYASATQYRTYTVQDTAKPVITLDETLEAMFETGTVDAVRNEEGTRYEASLPLRTAMTAKMVSGTEIEKSNVVITIKDKTTGTTETMDQTAGDYAFVPGAYIITYTVKNPSNANAETTISREITVTEPAPTSLSLDPTGTSIVTPDELTPDQETK